MKILLNLTLCFALFFLIACGGEKPKKPVKRPAKTTSLSEKPVEKKMVSEENASTKEEAATEEEEPPQVEPIPKEQLDKAKSIIEAADADAVAAVDAKKKYKTYCAACHGFTGDLNVNGAKDLTASKINLVESVAQVYFGKGLMTPFKGLMKDEELVAVAKYIETLRK